MQRIMTLLSVLCLVSYMNALSFPDNQVMKSDFDAYRAKFDKKYDTNAQDEKMQTYAANLKEIENFNGEDHEWKKGVNQFTDMTVEERNKYLGLAAIPDNSTNNNNAVNSANSTKDETKTPTLSGLTTWGVKADNSATNAIVVPDAAAAAKAKPTFQNIAQNINWVTSGVVSPVKNQGSCGGCYGFSALGLVESLYKLKYKQEINLSEQEIVSCSSGTSKTTTGNSGCNGGLINNALKYVMTNGVHNETQYGYKAAASNCLNLATDKGASAATFATSKAVNATIKIASYKEVGKNSLLDLLNALQTSPVAIAMFVTNDLYSYTKGVFPASSCASVAQSGSVNHAVLAVGYSLTGDQDSSFKPYILIKNSWGTTWGQAGYFKLEMPLVDGGNGSCNITRGGYNFTATIN